MKEKPYLNKRKLVEAILTHEHKNEIFKKFEIDINTLNKAIKDSFGIKGSLEEIKALLIKAANDNPDSPIGLYVSVIMPELVLRKPKEIVTQSTACGAIYSSNSVYNSMINPRGQCGLPFKSWVENQRARGGTR